MKQRFPLWRKLPSYTELLAGISADNRLFMRRVVFIGAMVMLLVLVSAMLTWLMESNGRGNGSINTFWDGIWWAIVTVATVGYGDKVPITFPGRVVGSALILFGYVTLSVFTGLIASVFVEDRLKGAKGLKPIRTSHHILLCGWNQTAVVLLQALVEKNIGDTLIGIIANQSVEFFESIESQFPTLQLHFVRGEPTQEDTLRRAAVQNAELAIILADQALSHQSADDRSIIIANAIYYISRKVKVTVQLMNAANKNLLHRMGIESIIISDELSGYLMANTILESRYLELYEHLAKDHEQLMKIKVIPDQFVERTYGDLFDYFYKEEKLLLLGIFTKEPELDINDIFTDNASAIDQFIKSALNRARKTEKEKRTTICWNLSRQTAIGVNDMAIVMSGER